MNQDLQQANALRDMIKTDGYRILVEYILGQQALKFSECSNRGTSSEDILKAIGSIDALKRLMNWAENQSKS